MDELIKAKGKALNWKEFYSVLRDSILGLVYIHINNISHRDIKPQNLLKLRGDNYCLCDYGEGVNLNYL